MPRHARLDVPGVLYHIIIRGMERRAIFTDDRDYEDFLSRLHTVLGQTATRCYAWSLMPNHAHILLRRGNVSLSTVMARILTGFVVTFNKRHQRVGRLFQNRYKSVICEEDPYLMELVRYIHLNPLRASLVADLAALADYPFTGHRVLIGRAALPWQDTEAVLSLFGGNTEAARREYLLFVEKGVCEGRKAHLTGGGLQRRHGGWREGRDVMRADERILGSSDFVQQVLAESGQRLHHSYAIRQDGHTLESVSADIAMLYGIPPDNLRKRTKEKPIADARSLLCYVAATDLGVSATELARRFSLSQPAITYAIRRGRRIAEKTGYALGGKL